MRIAVLVHGAVDNDARVIKEAVSLTLAGHEVVIHGIAPGLARRESRLPGSDIPVLLEPRVSGPAQLRKRCVQALLACAGVGALTLLSFWVSSHSPVWSGHDLRWPAILTLGVCAVGLVYAGRHRVAQGVEHVNDFLGARWAAMTGGDGADPIGADLNLGRGFRVVGAALLRSLARRPAPEAIHIHDHVALALAATLRQRYAVPITWDAHEIYQDMAGGSSARARENAAIIAARHRYIDHFITINDSIARFYREHYPALPSPVVVMNATPPEPVPVYDGRLHQAASLPPTQKILLFQGRFSAHRGLSHLVEAAAVLRDDWTLVMMGWGGLEAELRRVAAQHGRDGAPATVFLPGVPQQELQQWSAGATLGVVPYENTSLNHLYCTPNKLWEYPGAGVPVLCTDLPEMAAMLAEFGFGLLLPREFKAADIAQVVNALDEATLASLRAHCAPFIDTNNWSRWERNLLDVYAGMVAGHGQELASTS